MAVMSSCGFHYHVSNSCVIEVTGRKDQGETYHMITHSYKQIKESATGLKSINSISGKGGGFIQFAANLHLHLHRSTSLEG